MILLVDNYDSFTYNLAHQLGDIPTIIRRNDANDLIESAQKASAIIFSPGPGHPKEAGQMERLIKEFHQSKPMLGICLGHQALAETFGGEIVSAPTIKHGKTSRLSHQQTGLFQNFPVNAPVMRYHSLVVKRSNLPACFQITAETEGLIMAIQHRTLPLFGLQFHPESIGTSAGQQLITNFLHLTEVYHAGNF